VGHSLHWSGYRIRLEATRAHRLRQPKNIAIVAYKLSVTNGRSAPAHFDSVTAALVYQYLGEPRGAHELPRRDRLPHMKAFGTKPIAPGDIRTAWVQFALPAAALQELAPVALDFGQAGGGQDGAVLRLWRPATPEGAAAAQPQVF
jgi:hypothetical protein